MFPSQPDERIFPSQTWVPTPVGSTYTPSTWQAVQPAYGLTVASEDVNGVQAQATYDDQGRLLTTTPPGALQTPASGVTTNISYAAYDGGVPGTTGLQVTTTAGGAKSTVISDPAGRALEEQHLGFDGSTVDTQTSYDTLGRPIKTSRPFADGTAPQYFGSVVYDGLDRVLASTTPDGKTTNHSWTFFAHQITDANGITHPVAQAFTTDPVGNQTVVETDMDGRVIQSGTLMPDPAPATTSSWQNTMFHYQPFGLQDIAQTPTGAQQTTSYDTLGRIIGTVDPDAGTTTGYVYDGFGELLSKLHVATGAPTSDAKTTYSYDPTLGRELGWSTTEDSTTSAAMTTTSATFTYDTATNGLGKLASATSGDGVSYTYGYDSIGRPASTTETIGGIGYTASRTYDTEGRTSALNYPSIGVNYKPGLTLTTKYNASEYPQTLTDQTANPKSITGATTTQGLWRITSRYADGMLAAASSPTAGQGVALTQQQYPTAAVSRRSPPPRAPPPPPPWT